MLSEFQKEVFFSYPIHFRTKSAVYARIIIETKSIEVRVGWQNLGEKSANYSMIRSHCLEPWC